MKKAVKISMIVAGCLMGTGLIFGLIGMTLIGFDFGNIDDPKFQKVTKIIDKNENVDKLDRIMIYTISDDIEYKVSEDETLKIDYYASDKIVYDIDIFDDSNWHSHEYEEEENEDETSEVSDNIKNNEDDESPTGISYGIWIRQDDERKWYEKIGIHPFSWKYHKLTVYLPKEDYKEIYAETISGDITLKTKLNVSEDSYLSATSGDIIAENISSDEHLNISTVSGDIMLKNIHSDKDSDIFTTSGDITLKNISTNGLLDISTTSGDITAEYISANDFSITTVSGDINASLPEGLDYHTKTTSGDIDIPKSVKGGKKCTLSTVSGDINVEERE